MSHSLARIVHGAAWSRMELREVGPSGNLLPARLVTSGLAGLFEFG